MKSYEEVEETRQRLVSVTCNLCGRASLANPYVDDWFSAEKTWSYGTKYDGETHNLDLCFDCYTHLIKRMTIKPWQTGGDDPYVYD